MSTHSIPIEDTWALADIFEDDDAFEQAREAFTRDILPRLTEYRGRVLESASVLADALELDARALEQFQLLLTYAALKADEDIRIDRYQAMRQQVQLLGTEVSRSCSFLRPEILAGDPERIEEFLAGEERLVPFAHNLRDLIRQRAHVLSPDEERIVAETGLTRGDASTFHGVFTSTEQPRPEVRLSDGETVRLTTVAFQKHRTTANRDDRLQVFSSYFSSYSDFRNSLALNLYSAVKNHIFLCRVRNYGSCLEAALDSDNVPETVYRNLIAQVRRRLPTLHRYLRARARALDLPRLEYPDLYCPLTRTPARRYSVADARTLVEEGCRPLGREYGEVLSSAFAGRWIDWHPGPGKRPGAYANGWAYQVHPYVLVNFNEDYDGVLTLAHEMGHALHSHYSNETQPFPTADYSIFVAEVASTFNEALVLRRMLGQAADREEKLFILASYLDGVRGTLFRQTMFAEFELEIHDRAERGEVLTGELLNEIYLGLLRDYHGHDEGVMEVAEEFAVEWAAIPHFYYNFYVYQYATGIVAASALAGAVLDDQPESRERYLRFLRSGGSNYPLELLRQAGVDLEGAAPFDEAFATIEARLDDLDQVLGEDTASPAGS